MKRLAAISVLLLVAEPVRSAPRPAGFGSDRGAIVAVFDIEASGVSLPSAARERLSVYLTAKVAGLPGFRVVPRDQLRRRLRQQKRDSYKECYDQSCQIEIGKELAAQKSVSAKILRLGKACVVTLALYDLRSSATEKAADATGGCGLGDLVRGVEQATQKLIGQPVALHTSVLGVVDRKHCPGAGARRGGEPPPKGRMIWCVDQSGTRNGPSITWYPNGKKFQQGSYRDNQQHGRWTLWHRSGEKLQQGQYASGRKTGVWSQWDRHGNVIERGPYRDGMKNGVWTRYLPGGVRTSGTRMSMTIAMGPGCVSTHRVAKSSAAAFARIASTACGRATPCGAPAGGATRRRPATEATAATVATPSG